MISFCNVDFTFRETTPGTTATTTQGVTTSGTTPDDWIPGCPCNGLEAAEYVTCQMENAEACDPGPPGMNSSIFRSESSYQLQPFQTLFRLL